MDTKDRKMTKGYIRLHIWKIVIVIDLTKLYLDRTVLDHPVEHCEIE